MFNIFILGKYETKQQWDIVGYKLTCVRIIMNPMTENGIGKDVERTAGEKKLVPSLKKAIKSSFNI